MTTHYGTPSLFKGAIPKRHSDGARTITLQRRHSDGALTHLMVQLTDRQNWAKPELSHSPDPVMGQSVLNNGRPLMGDPATDAADVADIEPASVCASGPMSAYCGTS